jgi:hypothetical protein
MNGLSFTRLPSRLSSDHSRRRRGMCHARRLAGQTLLAFEVAAIGDRSQFAHARRFLRLPGHRRELADYPPTREQILQAAETTLMSVARTVAKQGRLSERARRLPAAGSSSAPKGESEAAASV